MLPAFTAAGGRPPRRRVRPVTTPPPSDPHPGALARWLDPGLIVPIVQAVLLALLGFFLTGRITNALEQRKLDLASVKEMQEQLLVLHRETVPADSASASAAALAAYGSYAVAPFIDLIDHG